MINLFRTLNPVNILVLLGYTFFMRLAIFFHLPDKLSLRLTEPYTAVFLNINQLNISPIWNVLIATLLVFIQALLFNRIVNNHGLLNKASYLPSLMYITGMSLFLPFATLSAPLLSNFLVLFIINNFLKLSKNNEALSLMYDNGVLIALGTLLYFPFIVFLLMIWLSLMLYRPFYWREWIAGIIGFLTIFLFVAVYYYWNDILPDFLEIWRPLTNKFIANFQLNLDDYLILIPISIVLILALLNIRKNFFKSFISTRKAFQMLFFLFFVSFISFYTKATVTVNHFILSIIPGAIFFAYYFTNIKKPWFYETLFALLVLSIQYFLFV